MLESCGVKLDIDGLRTTLHPPQRLNSQKINVPGDFSSAAFFIVAGLLAAPAEGLLIQNVGLNPTRIGLLTILRRMGANIDILKRARAGPSRWRICAYLPRALHGIRVPKDLVSLAIDELPGTVHRRSLCGGGDLGHRRGGIARQGERSDRRHERRLGVARRGAHSVAGRHADQGRGQGTAFAGGEIDSFGDHRIAMSFAIASLRAAGAIGIRDVANVATSFPGFVPLARSVGLCHQRDWGLRFAMKDVSVITIDGPSGSGKGTISRAVARALGWALLDSGALYRLVALAARRASISLDDAAALARLAERFDIRFGSDRVRARKSSGWTTRTSPGRFGPRGREMMPPRSRRWPRCARRSWSANGASRFPRVWWPTGAIWAPWYFPRPT